MCIYASKYGLAIWIAVFLLSWIPIIWLRRSGYKPLQDGESYANMLLAAFFWPASYPLVGVGLIIWGLVWTLDRLSSPPRPVKPKLATKPQPALSIHGDIIKWKQ